MTSQLPKIDRWHSEPLDVHRWSDHPEIKTLCDHLYVDANLVDVEALLVDAGYIEELKHYQSKSGLGRSYTTRFRHTEMLREHFSKLTVELHDIDSHSNEECIILHDKYVDDPQVISLGPDNKYVTRVFNGGLAGNWELGGRFYRGWWQQINKEDRCKIYINDMPTLEVDFKAFHPNLLSNELGVKLPNDPYDLEELILPETITTYPKQREYVKLLVLMAINADNDKKAYQAFRDSDRKDKLGQSLTDKQLSLLLKKFINKHPQFDGILNTGQALRLMNIDSQIANLVIDHE